MELNGLLLKFFCYITWLLYQLIRRDTGRLANEDFASNPIVPWKQLNGLKITNWFCYITWLDATVDDLQTRSLRQILLSLRNNGLTNGLKDTNWSQKNHLSFSDKNFWFFSEFPCFISSSHFWPIECILSSPLSAGGGVEPLTKFSKRGEGAWQDLNL